MWQDVNELNVGIPDFQPKIKNLTKTFNYGNFLERVEQDGPFHHELSRGFRRLADLITKEDFASIKRIFNSSGMNRKDFASVIFDALPEDPDALRLPEPEEITETYKTRDRAQYSDPLDYLRKKWGSFMDAGILFQRDLRRLDPTLIPAVRAYCQRKAAEADSPEEAAKFVANDHLPPSNKQRTRDVSQTIEGTDAHILAVRRERDRIRMAGRRPAATPS